MLDNQECERAANVAVVERSCTVTAEHDGVTCGAIVTDDAYAILGVDPAPSEFVIRVVDGEIEVVSVRHDNPQQVEDLFNWIVTSRPDPMEGPCNGVLTATGPAAGCAIATTEAAAEFVQTADYVAP